MHKHTKLLPYQRREIFRRWAQGEKVTILSQQFFVSRPTIYKVVENAKLGIFENRKSMNKRYQAVYYGLRKLSKKEKEVAKKIAKRERRNNRYEKTMPGEMVHMDTKRLPLMPGEAIIQPREYMFVAIDDYSRWIYVDIFPDKTAYSAAIFLEEVKRAMPFHIEQIYTDNGSEYKGRKDHPFVSLCRRYGIAQSFTKVRHPQTNGKAERLHRTLMQEWHKRRHFTSRDERRRFLYAYCSWYNQSRLHQSLNSTPLERLESFLARVKEESGSVNNA